MERFAPAISFEDRAYQNYVQGLKFYWKHQLYARMAQDIRHTGAADAVALETRMRSDSSAYRLYGWLEHHLQQFKYVGRHGMLPVMERQAQRLTEALDLAATQHPERLRLNPQLELPLYYTRSDFHQHPGGIWSDDVDAFAYEWAANDFTFSMVSAERPYRWMAQYLAERFEPRSFVDLGCGFGKLAIPFKRARPDARVVGVDLAAPLLRLAHLRSIEEGLDVEWLQANAESTPLAAGSQDAVACYWLLHELPPQAIDNVLAEALRLARPGGIFASFDMHTAPGAVAGEFLSTGHSARNNEPYLPGLIHCDIHRSLERAGFEDVEVVQALSGGPAETADAPLAETRTHTFTVAIGRKPRQ